MYIHISGLHVNICQLNTEHKIRDAQLEVYLFVSLPAGLFGSVLNMMAVNPHVCCENHHLQNWGVVSHTAKTLINCGFVISSQ